MKFPSPTINIRHLTGLLAALCLFTSACATEQERQQEEEQGPLVTDEPPTDATTSESEAMAKPASLLMGDCDTEVRTNLVTVDLNAAGTQRVLTPHKAVSKPGTAFYFVSTGPAFTVNFETACGLLADPSKTNTPSGPVMGGAQGAEVQTTSEMDGASRIECSYTITNNQPPTSCRQKPVIIIER